MKTDNYVQVSGYGDLTKINIAPGDSGGQFDSDGHMPEGAAVSVDGQDASSWVVSLPHNVSTVILTYRHSYLLPHSV